MFILICRKSLVSILFDDERFIFRNYLTTVNSTWFISLNYLGIYLVQLSVKYSFVIGKIHLTQFKLFHQFNTVGVLENEMLQTNLQWLVDITQCLAKSSWPVVKKQQ